jgi:hypothetical protein
VHFESWNWLHKGGSGGTWLSQAGPQLPLHWSCSYRLAASAGNKGPEAGWLVHPRLTLNLCVWGGGRLEIKVRPQVCQTSILPLNYTPSPGTSYLDCLKLLPWRFHSLPTPSLLSPPVSPASESAPESAICLSKALGGWRCFLPIPTPPAAGAALPSPSLFSPQPQFCHL